MLPQLNNSLHSICLHFCVISVSWLEPNWYTLFPNDHQFDHQPQPHSLPGFIPHPPSLQRTGQKEFDWSLSECFYLIVLQVFKTWWPSSLCEYWLLQIKWTKTNWLKTTLLLERDAVSAPKKLFFNQLYFHLKERQEGTLFFSRRRCVCVCVCMRARACAHVLRYVWFSVTPRTVARQAPIFMEFSRQEYWSGLPFLPPGDLHDPGIQPESLEPPALAGGFFTSRSPGRPRMI